MKFTVLGSSGFVGRHLVKQLMRRGFQVDAPPREAGVLRGASLGHVIYAIGLTGDFRNRPYDTIDAHVNLLADWMKATQFDSWLYLSSTRIYGRLPPDSLCTETTPLTVLPTLDCLYDLSKLLGEALCLQHETPTIRVARLANVYGNDQSEATFLGSVLRDLRAAGRATISEASHSSKDYISIKDVVALLINIALSGHARIYNVASGVPITHKQIADRLGQLGNYKLSFRPGAAARIFPKIDIERLRQEFGFQASSMLEDLGSLSLSLARND